ncbi:hypothetical protein, partial [Neptunomonas phycophila]|uniref:hypothetical protein n=1 Tax=Neptunomonas phycophila TaxID=1572645 RepID=UPI00351180B8
WIFSITSACSAIFSKLPARQWIMGKTRHRVSKFSKLPARQWITVYNEKIKLQHTDRLNTSI